MTLKQFKSEQCSRTYIIFSDHILQTPLLFQKKSRHTHDVADNQSGFCCHLENRYCFNKSGFCGSDFS